MTFKIPTKIQTFVVHRGVISIDGPYLDPNETYSKSEKKTFDRYRSVIEDLISDVRKHQSYFEKLAHYRWDVTVTTKGWGWVARYTVYVKPITEKD